jgi:hypothetical protein
VWWSRTYYALPSTALLYSTNKALTKEGMLVATLGAHYTRQTRDIDVDIYE